MSAISLTVVVLKTWRIAVGISSTTNIVTLDTSVRLMGMKQGARERVPHPEVQGSKWI